MRKDMFKVIVERARLGDSDASKKGRWKQKAYTSIEKASWDSDCYDEPSNWEKIKPSRLHADRKELNENLSPLWRFLHSRVGQYWDDVYSEIREHLSPKNAVQMHVVQHLKAQVVESTYLGENGRVYQYSEYVSPQRELTPLDEPVPYSLFYVHPVNGKLCKSPRKSRKEKNPKEKNKIKLTELRQYRLIDGIWYVVEFEKISPKLGVKLPYFSRSKQYKTEQFAPVLDYAWVSDCIFPYGISNGVREREYGYCNIRAISKRQLGKRELKHIKTLLSST